LAGILALLGLAFDFLATVMTGFGLCSKDPQKKYTLYRFALYVMVAARKPFNIFFFDTLITFLLFITFIVVVILITLVIYPAQFAAEFDASNRQIWELGWAYGVGWGAAIFLFGAILLLLCDKETEEIYFKERTIVHNSSSLPNEMKA